MDEIIPYLVSDAVRYHINPKLFKKQVSKERFNACKSFFEILNIPIADKLTMNAKSKKNPV